MVFIKKMYDLVLLCTTIGRTSGTVAVTWFEGCKNGVYDRTTKKHKPYKGVCMCEYIFYHYIHTRAYRSKNRSYKSYKSYIVAITSLDRTTYIKLGRTKSYK